MTSVPPPTIAWSVGGLAAAIGGIVLLVVAAVGIFLARRRWAWAAKMTDHPFTVYVVLSLIAHLVLAIWAYTARLFDTPTSLGNAVVTVELGDEQQPAPTALPPWDEPPTETVQATVPQLPPEALAPSVEPSKPTVVEETFPDDSPLDDSLPVAEEPTPPASRWSGPAALAATAETNEQREDATKETASEVVEKDETLTEVVQQEVAPSEQPAPRAKENEAVPQRAPPTDVADSMATRPLTPTTRPQPRPIRQRTGARPLRPVTTNWGGHQSEIPVRTSATPVRSDGRAVPNIYRDRFATDRMTVLQARGGSAETEAAVQAALSWLAANQREDGRWDASQFGGGQSAATNGHDRQRAGLHADPGVTGLAVLAFLGAGHTHLQGEYQDTVRRGVEYLLRVQTQRHDGSIVGSAGTFAAMYCHGIATLAISECFAITGDPVLTDPVRRAVAFSLAAQHPVSGGWRYRPHEPGDTSQMGWQLMALTSAHYAGVPIPRSTWTRASRFLNSVAWGSHGGLSSYRPGERPSAPMTAEALMCRLFLGLSSRHALVDEAADYLIRRLPGNGRINFYYWYYGTLALYQVHDERWTTWNNATKKTLLPLQESAGVLAGSWNTDSVWGGSGGRVYTTALAALTLEVYYRYRPPAEGRPDRTAQRSLSTSRGR